MTELKSFMLNNTFGIFLYLLLPNHWTWDYLLSNSEKKIILDACYRHNKAQYVIPENYNREHERRDHPEQTMEGKLLQYTLKKYSPSSVLEFGPGSGFFTKQIFSFPSVKEYHAIDIVQPFLEFVKREIAAKQNRIKSAFICGDFLKHGFGQKYDLILFMATLHHIPNRVEYLKKCSLLLSDKGVIVFIEPTHHFNRILKLLKDFYKEYHKKSYWCNRENLSTHHHITMLEVNYIRRKCNMKINETILFNIIGERYASFLSRSKLGFPICSRFNPFSIFAGQIYVSFSKNHIFITNIVRT